MFYGLEEEDAPNFDVMCFDEYGDCIDHEYFEDYASARKFADAEQTKLDYEWVSITPMNPRAAEMMM